jgi:hypothetical protein
MSSSQLQTQYIKVSQYLSTQNKKLKKYKTYKSQLYSTISDHIRNQRHTTTDYPELTIETKSESSSHSFSESLLRDYLETVYSSPQVRDLFMDNLLKFRKSKQVGNKASYLIQPKFK